MNILMPSAEIAPFAKVGGLADVLGSLPKALAKCGLNVSLVMPRYGLMDSDLWGFELRQKAGFAYWMGKLPGSEVPVYFIEQPELFGSRQTVYPMDNPALEFAGFYYLNEAVFDLIELEGLPVDIIHAHDWHTARIPDLVVQKSQTTRFANTKSILTIHNLAYQGVEAAADDYIDVDITPEAAASHQKNTLNWLKSGLSSADMITTVSPTYAKEIQTSEYGAGLDGLLRSRSQDLVGILNGIDTDLYNPATDPFIPQAFTTESFVVGKAACKRALQEELGLPIDPDIPMVGFVGRLVEQKGLDILLPAIEMSAAENLCQWVLLGSGHPTVEATLKSLNSRFPNVNGYIGMHLPRAQHIYAGSDLYAMPSRYEPCGLGQMIALRYGSVPIVRPVGGLADTVRDIRRDAANGNGYHIAAHTPEALMATLRDAVQDFRQQETWRGIIIRAMTEPLDWDSSAKLYVQLYQELLRS